MNHAPIVPIVLPALAAALMLLDRRLGSQRLLAWVSLLLNAACVTWMLALAADGWRAVYLVGNWSAPWGIVLVADRLAVMMLALTALLGLVVLTASHRCDAQGPHFHPLLQIQLMGLNGAFLTADLFNLFVFFEVLLIASYGLLVHGDTARRVGEAMRFVTLNLLGSALFLLGASLLYGVTGTLTFADLAHRVGTLDPMQASLARSAGAMLLTVFCLKAAVLPLGLWLPRTYAAAAAPVAALFAIMTKVGIYAVLRVFTTVFGSEAGESAHWITPWMAALGTASFGLAALCSLAAHSLRRLIGLLVVASAGFLMIGIGLGDEHSIAASLVYLPHTTLSAAVLYLVAGELIRARGDEADDLRADVAPGRAAIPGWPYALAAVAAAGLPPFSGFIAKAMLLASTLTEAPDTGPGVVGLTAMLWLTVLLGSLLITVALVRCGARLFWSGAPPKGTPWSAAVRDAGARRDAAAIGVALVAIAALTVAMAPVQRYAQATAAELLDPAPLIDQVLAARPRPGPHTPSPARAP